MLRNVRSIEYIWLLAVIVIFVIACMTFVRLYGRRNGASDEQLFGRLGALEEQTSKLNKQVLPIPDKLVSLDTKCANQLTELLSVGNRIAVLEEIQRLSAGHTDLSDSAYRDTYMKNAFDELNLLRADFQILKGFWEVEHNRTWHRMGSGFLNSENWRKDFALPFMKEVSMELGRPFYGRGIYEFGIYTGHSVKEIGDWLYSAGMVTLHQYCFDSFVGLPFEIDAVHSKTNYKDWSEGNFNALAASSSISLHDAIAKVLKKIVSSTSYPADNIHMIPGFFSTSLNPWLKDAMHLTPAAYIDIDTDLYVGAFQALDFMFGNGLVEVGTIVGYDDWCSSQKWTTLEDGEARAHSEITEKYRVKWSMITKQTPLNSVVMRVEGIGVGDYTNGCVLGDANYCIGRH